MSDVNDDSGRVSGEEDVKPTRLDQRDDPQAKELSPSAGGGLIDEEAGESDSMPDSSEEDDEEEDEEEIQRIREGFIVDDDDEDDARRRRKKQKKLKKKRLAEIESKRERDDELDEDDLDLLRENTGAASEPERRFKRLKRAKADEDIESERRGLTDMFSEEENEEELANEHRTSSRPQMDEFDGFIEEDELSGEDEQDKYEREARSRSNKSMMMAQSSIDNDKLSELYDVFGDGEEYDWALQEEGDHQNDDLREGGDHPTALADVFEQSELKERMLTEEDNQIRMTDVPERFQAYRKGLRDYDSMSNDDFGKEKEWVSNELFKEKQSMFQGANSYLVDPFKAAVGKVLDFISKELLEVPFIFSHRRDYLLHTYTDEMGHMRVEKLLKESDLWRIVQLDVEFHTMCEKKQSVVSLYKSLELTDEIFDEFLQSAKTMVEFQDLYDYLNFSYSAEIKDKSISKDENAKKRHVKSPIYEKIKSDAIYSVVKAIGIDASKFAENISTEHRVYQTEDPVDTPEAMVDSLVSAGDSRLFYERNSALSGVKQMFGEELFYNPKVRSNLRLAFQTFSNIDIALTEKGQLKIDGNSAYADFKYAINRPIASFAYTPDQFLRILEAEQLGLVHVKISIKAFDKFTDHLYSSLSSDGTSDIAVAWNTIRRASLEVCLQKLIPMICLNVKESLRRDCERLLFGEIRASFLKKIDQAPYQPKGFERGTVPRVVSISHGKGGRDDAVLSIMLDEEGKLTDHVKFEFNPRTEEFTGEFIKMIQANKPDVIAVSGSNVQANFLYKKLCEIVTEQRVTVSEDPDLDFGTENNEPPLLDVVWVNDETARLYHHSLRSQQEFPDKPEVSKYCIAVARYVQSPLLEYVSLGQDMSSLSIHKHQSLIPKEQLWEAIETVLVDVCNMVGVEIDDACRDAYLALPLPYIAGLGPRKASGLLQSIQSKGSSISSRSDLITQEMVTPRVFVNCASFIKMKYDERGLNNDEVEILDCTRIHPEDYDLARKMAADALDLDEEDIEDDTDVIAQLVREGAEKLDSLVLEEYGNQLEVTYHQKKRATLQMIKEELQHHFEELRRPFHILTEEEVFKMLTGETFESFAPGVVIPVSIRRVDERFLGCVTQSMIDGNVQRSHMLEYNDYREPSTVFRVDQTVPASILSVDYPNFKCQLSLLAKDVNAPSGKFVDKYEGLWDFDAERQEVEAEKNRAAIEARSARLIKHTYFHNFNSRQAEDYLAAKQIGDYVIRPSSKGSDHITVTWKVDNQLFQHVDVVEEKKPNEFSLGKVLRIGSYKYSDLDELLVSYVGAVSARVDDMVHHEKFRKGPFEDVKEWLQRYSEANKNRSCYTFCFNRKSPGWFFLLFKLNPASEIKTWHVKALPEGYSLAGNVYPNIQTLCNGFKSVVANKQRDKVRTGTGRAPVSVHGGYAYGAAY